MRYYGAHSLELCLGRLKRKPTQSTRSTQSSPTICNYSILPVRICKHYQAALRNQKIHCCETNTTTVWSRLLVDVNANATFTPPVFVLHAFQLPENHQQQ
ncbi:hypothetical protein PISMIDRAFT_414849 [Pisolithus microcarpus 441]|uniref:Unplaced genomic scaffold scaffold_34, whole genome shotgun sequence n=1 Tax=Pisolithus microcarpus 441 TaxID=765257 RepID=A0A0C9ZE91_9AGAM|nr:hypothetical protein PISMIDRAFT_414849 [Pisolithus microcarpus 441]